MIASHGRTSAIGFQLLIKLITKTLILSAKVSTCCATVVLIFGLTLGLLFKFFPWTVGYVVFMNHIHFPPFRNFSDLESHHLEGQNIYLKHGDISLGVWHLDKGRDDVTAEAGKPVVLYIHGAQGSRAAYHRTQLYRIIRKLGSPVVTFDYRGYGDSTGVPGSELHLWQDAKAVYQWTLSQYPNRPVFLWGHSLGTGVSVRLVQSIETSGSHVDGLILDSPYSCIFDVMHSSPLFWPFHQVPAFTDLLLHALEEADVTLNSSDRIRTTKVPLLILHAEDDWVIPVTLGRKLYQVAKSRDVDAVTEFVEYSAKFKYGHRGIYRDPNLPILVGNFMRNALEWKANQKEM